MTPIEKAQKTLAYFSGNGKMTEEQSTQFLAYVLMPHPPVRPKGIHWLYMWPVYLYRWRRFMKVNNWWEAEFRTRNPMVGRKG